MEYTWIGKWIMNECNIGELVNILWKDKWMNRLMNNQWIKYKWIGKWLKDGWNMNE